MKAFCSLWLCLGRGNSKADGEGCNHDKAKEDVQPADCKVVAQKEDGFKQEPRSSCPGQDRDTASLRSPCTGKDKGDDAPRSVVASASNPIAAAEPAFPAGLLRNERTMRALLQKAKRVLSERAQLQQQDLHGPLSDDEVSYVSILKSSADPELLRLNTQLMETCNTPRPDSRALLRLELLLSEVRRWLAARPSPAAATAVLYAVGDGLMHAEHAVRSGGQVRFWQPDNVAAFLPLLQLYADLLLQAGRAAQHQRQLLALQRQGRNGQDLGASVSRPGNESGQPHHLHTHFHTQQHENQNHCLPATQQDSDSDTSCPEADQTTMGQQQQLQQQPPLPAQEAPIDSSLDQSTSARAPNQQQQHPPHPPQQQQHRHLHRQAPLQQHPLTFAVAALLLRPDWLDLLTEALELLHFSEEYRAAARRADLEPQDALGAALRLWGFLTQLVKFAAAYADSVQRMSACLQRLATLLAPPSGAVPRLLALPMAEGTLVAQLHVLWLLQVLYDMPDAKVLYSPALADHCVALHHSATVQHYEASAADPKSASAELCRIHATLLRSLARHPGQPVRAAFAVAGTAHWILQQVALESEVLPAAGQEEEEGEDGGEDAEEDNGGSDEDGDDSDEGEESAEGESGGEEDRRSEAAERRGGEEGCSAQGSGRERSPGGSTAEAGGNRPAASRTGSKAFKTFTYDLNEDVERLLDLEDQLGHEMEVDGFEYDEEGKVLKAKSDTRQAEAAAAAAEAEAAAAAAATATQPSPREPTQQQQQEAEGTRETQEDAAVTASGAVAAGPSRQSCGSWAASSPNQRSSTVPRLALAGLRCSSISSMATQSPAPRRLASLHHRPSITNSMLGAASERLEEETEEGSDEDDDALSEEPRTPTLDSAAAAAAAERVACWSSSLVEAYAAAANGDTSKVPYPPGSRSGGATGCAPSLPATTASAAAQSETSPKGMTGGEEGRREPEPAGPPARPREMTTGSPVHAGPQGELHIMLQNTGSSRAAGQALGRPPLPGKPSLPPLKVGAAAGDAAGGPVGQSPSTSARVPPPGSSRAMVLLSASNRANAGVWAASPAGSQQQQQQHHPPWSSAPSSARDLNGQFSAFGSESAASTQGTTTTTTVTATAADVTGTPAAVSGSSGAGASPRRPPQPLIPALNLKSLRRRDGGGPTTDTGRTVPLSSMLRSTHGGSLSHCSGMDSANTLLPTGSSTLSSTAAMSSSYASPPAAYGPTSTGGEAPCPSSSPPHPPQGGASSGPLHRIAEAEPEPPPRSIPEATYEELACQRLLYQDRTTHLLLLKTLMDLLVAPSGALDAAYVPQYPAHSGAPHAEFILLWHLNAPRNAGVVHDLCRGAQHRAKLSAAAAAVAAVSRQQPLASVAAASTAAAEADGVRSCGTGPVGRPPSTTAVQPYDSAREHSGTHSADVDRGAQPATVVNNATPARAVVADVAVHVGAPYAAGMASAAAAAAGLGRPSAITRALQLLSRTLFDAGRYCNLQFAARGAYGDIFRARMEPHRTSSLSVQAAGGEAAAAAGVAPVPAAAAGPVQVVIKTIQLPGVAFDSCVLADVFGEVSVMERFKGHDCICQLLDYGMREDAYWIVMRRYRCSLAEWRARQRPLDTLPPPAADTATLAAPSSTAVAAAAAAAVPVYLSALLQVVDALRLLASHHVVHFDLKCANVLIEPLPGVRDGELWAPIGAVVRPPAEAAEAAAGGSDSTGGTAAAPSQRHWGVPFRCVLADFGEARAYRCAEEAFTARNRGTEVFKSPEMLMLNAGARGAGLPPPPAGSPGPAPSGRPSPQPQSAGRPTSPPPTSPAGGAGPASPSGGDVLVGSPGSARRGGNNSASKQRSQQSQHPRQPLAGAGLASDIWSLGCLAYELLSGTVLFSGDYASVTHRVAFGEGERLTLTEVERARLGGLPVLVELVEGILVRDPVKRPSLDVIRARVEQVRAELGRSV